MSVQNPKKMKRFTQPTFTSVAKFNELDAAIINITADETASIVKQLKTQIAVAKLEN
jgi:hypothetical protein